MQTEVDEYCEEQKRQSCHDRNCELRPPLARGFKRIPVLQHGVANGDAEPGIAPAADHREQAPVHLLDGLILGLHRYSTNVAIT